MPPPHTPKEQREHSAAFLNFKTSLSMTEKVLQLMEAAIEFAEKNTNQEEKLTSLLGVSPEEYPHLRKKKGKTDFSRCLGRCHSFFILEIHRQFAYYLQRIAATLRQTPVARVKENITLQGVHELHAFVSTFDDRNGRSLLRSLIQLFGLSAKQDDVDKALNLLQTRNYIAHQDKEGCKAFLQSDKRPPELQTTEGGNIIYNRKLSKTTYQTVLSLLEKMDAELVQNGFLEPSKKPES